MDNHGSQMLTPAEIVQANIKLEENRAKMPFMKMVVLGILAGIFISCGAQASNVAMHTIPNLGTARIVAGCVFAIGLMFVVFIGAELFTGDCLLILGVLEKKVKAITMVRILIVVFISNLIGSLMVVSLVNFSGQFGYSNDMLGAFTIKVAMDKAGKGFGASLASGILCNVFVCGAVLMMTSAKDAAGKVWTCFFSILAFIVSGFEHCVANMYYIPAGIVAKNNEAYATKAMELYGYTKEQLNGLDIKSFIVDSTLPVTIGNMIGGIILVGLTMWLAYCKNYDKKVKNLTK